VKTGGRLVKHARYLLAASGGEAPDATAVWSHGGAHCGSADAYRIGRGGRERNRAQGGGEQ
jgi:hypothetical protein